MADLQTNGYREESEKAEAREVRRRPLRRAGLVAALALGVAAAGFTAMNMIDGGVLNEGSRIADRARRQVLGQPVETITEPPAGAEGVVLEMVARYDGSETFEKRRSALETMCIIKDTRPFAPYTDKIEKLRKISDERSGDGSRVIRDLARNMAKCLEGQASFVSMGSNIEQQNRETRIAKIGYGKFEVTLDFYDTDGKLVESDVPFTSEYDPTKHAEGRRVDVGTFYNQQRSIEGMSQTGIINERSITPELSNFISTAWRFEDDQCTKSMLSELLISQSLGGDFREADPNVCNPGNYRPNKMGGELSSNGEWARDYRGTIFGENVNSNN